MPTTRPTTPHSRRAASLGGALTLVAVLAACATDGTSAQDAGTSSADASATSTTPSSTSAPSPTAPITGADETDAVTFGTAVWQAFYGDVDLPKDQWWAALEPLLSPAAANVHVYDEPQTFEPVEVTGPFSEAPKAPYRAGVTAEVYVPTDQGRYSLFLIRSTRTAPWRLESIGFPKEAN